MTSAQTRPNTAAHDMVRRVRPFDGTGFIAELDRARRTADEARARLTAVVTYCDTAGLTDGQRAELRRLAYGDHQD